MTPQDRAEVVKILNTHALKCEAEAGRRLPAHLKDSFAAQGRRARELAALVEGER
jgi:hypothetical protein